MYQIGDKILVADLDGPSPIREYTVTKILKDTVQCGSAENTFYTAFTWPARVRPQLQAILDERAKLKKAYDDSMGLIYELKNKITRKEI